MLDKPAKGNITVVALVSAWNPEAELLFSVLFGSSYLMALGYHTPTHFPELLPLPLLTTEQSYMGDTFRSKN